ncbi:MAG: aminotransferase class V-fold PLP-dependent enzyme [Eubacteriales bacterium]
MISQQPYSNWRNTILGANAKVPLSDNSLVTAINFDNAATTPPFVNVMQKINSIAPYYSSVHRGSGYKSALSSELYELSRSVVLDFVKGNPDHDIVIFVKNTTEAINKLSYRLLGKDDKHVILSTRMEHHSNDLPWRHKYLVDYIEIDENGRLRLDDLENKLLKHKGSVRLVTVTGASNVTGYLNPIYEIAEMAHTYEAQILVDAAQMAPHTPIVMQPPGSPRHIDYLAFSGHKMYAPFGTGVLIGPRETFQQGIPEYAGGGTVKSVTSDYVIWDDPPYKEEAGTPNVIGVISLKTAIETLNHIGMPLLCQHENKLWDYTIKKFASIPGLKIYCDNDATKPRIGIIPFNISGINHTLVADILSGEAGIATRTGCFCAQPYVRMLLKLTPAEILNCTKDSLSTRPGMVRISFGLYNDYGEIDVLVRTVSRIVENKDYYAQKYLHLSDRALSHHKLP